jgi:hypothetical protein
MRPDTNRQSPHRESYQARHLPPILPTWEAGADLDKASVWLRSVLGYRVVSTSTGRGAGTGGAWAEDA